MIAEVIVVFDRPSKGKRRARRDVVPHELMDDAVVLGQIKILRQGDSRHKCQPQKRHQ